MSGLPSILVLGLMVAVGLVGAFLSWSSGATFASIVFGAGALAMGLLMLSAVLTARRDRQG